jgi:hypothetical protein
LNLDSLLTLIFEENHEQTFVRTDRRFRRC